jgi:hypothetical protein
MVDEFLQSGNGLTLRPILSVTGRKCLIQLFGKKESLQDNGSAEYS